jgi:uncharacterized protein YgiM (DUF1202 family)
VSEKQKRREKNKKRRVRNRVKPGEEEKEEEKNRGDRSYLSELHNQVHQVSNLLFTERSVK